MPNKLLHDGWLTPEFQAVLDQIFTRFDVDEDGLWSIDVELQAFAMYGMFLLLVHSTNGYTIRGWYHVPCISGR